MQNTKTEYNSSERIPTVLPEMEQLLPPLSAEQFSALESDILENGCYSPIIVNKDMVIIDGHNRFRVCDKHSLANYLDVAGEGWYHVGHHTIGGLTK